MRKYGGILGVWLTIKKEGVESGGAGVTKITAREAGWVYCGLERIRIDSRKSRKESRTVKAL